MNRQRNGINWTDFSWNPVTGCRHGCPYCYARDQLLAYGRSFEPTFYPSRLRQPLQERRGARIFVCSVADLFGAWVPESWITAILDIVCRCPRHTFQFLTKNPRRLPTLNPWPPNAWVGCTVDTVSRLGPSLLALREVDAAIRFVSFEPLLEHLGQPNLSGVQWVIIGACTGSMAQQPAPRWVEDILAAADAQGCAVLMKDNLIWAPRREEFPRGVQLVLV